MKRQKYDFLRYKIDHFLQEGFANEESKTYRIINDGIVLLIFFSIASIVAASVESFYLAHQEFFDVSENIVVGIFTLEYLANLYVAQKKTSYVFGIWGIIDFLAIAPSYLSIIDLRSIKVVRVLRVLRFLRLMRLLKLAKHATSKYKESKETKIDTLKMDLQIYFIALFSVLVIFSTLMYYAEKNVEGTAYTSIPQAMWWCIVTITTVGYGDMYPVTVVGRIIAGVTMLCGLALFGLLTNVIGKSMMSSLFGTSDLDNTEIQSREVKKMNKVKKD